MHILYSITCFRSDIVAFFFLVGYHGVGGPVTVAQPPYQPKVKIATIEAARSLGFEFVDSAGPFQHGICLIFLSHFNNCIY